MENEDKYSNTHAAWDQLADRYRDGFNGLNIYEETYNEFCKMLPGKEVLELGCGPGTITLRLIAIDPGLKILATDVSPSMVESTVKLLPSVTTMLMDARHCGKLDKQFDGMVCGFVIPYLDKKDTKNLLLDTGKLLCAGGIFYLSYVPAEDYYEEMQSSSDGQFSMIFHRHSDEEIVNWAGMAGMRLLQSFAVEYSPEGRERQIHRVMLFRKKG